MCCFSSVAARVGEPRAYRSQPHLSGKTSGRGHLLLTEPHRTHQRLPCDREYPWRFGFTIVVLSYGFKCKHIVTQTLFTRSLTRQRPTPLDSPVFSTVDSTTATSATCCQVSSASSHHVNGLLQAGCCNVKVTIHFGWSVWYVVNEWAATLLDSNLKCRDTFVILDKAGTWNDLTCSCWSLWMDDLQPPASPRDRASWRWPMNGLAWASDSPPVKSRGALMVK